MGKFDNMNLSGFGDVVIQVSGSLYVKTEVAMTQLVHELEKIGYDVKVPEGAPNNWFANLSDIRKGKCGSCGELISTAGIQCHGHECEKCGDVTFWQILDGTVVRFSFISRTEGDESGVVTLKMKAKHWDTDAGFVYFYPLTTSECQGAAGSAQNRCLFGNKDKWEWAQIDGEEFIKMRYTQPWDPTVCVFNPLEFIGPYGKTYNHTIVKVWDGIIYDEWSKDFPLPDTINLYGTWHKTRLQASSTVHRFILRAAGQTDDKGWHYQDGRPWFTEGHWHSMSQYIRHFTELNADAFDAAWPKFRKSGPGGIDDLARWCHADAEVREEPNIGNLLLGFSKIASFEPLEVGEVAAMQKAVDHEPTFDTFSQAMGYKGGWKHST